MPCRDEDGGVWNEATTADAGENCTAESHDRRQARLDQRPVGGALVPPEAAASYLALLPNRPDIFAGIGEAVDKAQPSVDLPESSDDHECEEAGNMGVCKHCDCIMEPEGDER